MRLLKQFIYNSSVLLFKLKFWTKMIADLGSSLEPSPQKRIKLDTELDAKPLVTGSDDMAWRSKLSRNFDEIDVGITEFIGDFKPFEAVLKNRYEDFLVHEISKSGKIVRLTDNSRPEDEVIPVLDVYEVLDDCTIERIRQLLKLNEKSPLIESNDELIDDRLDAEEVNVSTNEEKLESNEEKSESKTEDESKGSGSDCDKSVKILVNELSKDERTRIHKAIKDNYEGLETETVTEESNKYILVKKRDQRGGKRGFNAWPKGKGEYIHFVLYKENKETQQAIQELALKMHVLAKNFSIAGTKDKRAITSQLVSAWKVPPKKIWSAAQRCSLLEVGHFRFEKSDLNLGDLKGNQFDVVLRDVKCEDRENAEQSLEFVKRLGFINYFGMQRFGHQHSRPYEIGTLILKQNWEQVVDRLLSPKPQDMKLSNRANVLSFNECIELWRTTRNAKSVYKKFAFKWTPEGTLLNGLTRVGPNDYHGAICTGMVRNQRLLYVHCYQSYVWNKTASFRVKTYGLEVVAGDLLLLGHKDADNDLKSKDLNSNIVIADEDNKNSFSIHDIVLPVIGSENLWPKNSVSDYIHSVLAEDEVTVDQFRDLPKQWCVFGTYRKLFVKPQNFDYNWVTYKDPNIPLIDSDLNVINKSKVCDIGCETELANDFDHKNEKVDSSGAGSEKLALKLCIGLPTSCYATMICRQITRTESTVLETKSMLKNKYGL